MTPLLMKVQQYGNNLQFLHRTASLCMYVYMYVSMHVCMYVCMYVCMSITIKLPYIYNVLMAVFRELAITKSTL